jgi:nucleotide-binding universal stress UspA family protein
MFDRILFPTDGSEGAAVAFGHVLDVAAAHDATVYVLNVADTSRDSVTRLQGDVVDVLEEEGEEVVREAAERAKERGVDVVTEVLQGAPADTIVDYAASRDVDLVVVPTRGRQGLERLLLGSTTERVVRRATVPVLTLDPDDGRFDHPYRNVLVATDGSDSATAAVTAGADVATANGATLHLVNVVDLASLGVDVRSDVQQKMLEESAEGVLDDAAETAAEAGVEDVTRAVEYGPAVHGAVLAYVDDNDVDLVVVGTQGRTGLDRYLLGSVTERLVRTSPVPVLTVRAPADES